MSVPEWFSEWAKTHCVAFGFSGEHAATVLAWGPKFVHLFTPDELHAVTEYLTGREDVPRFAADHRGLILSTARHLRQRAAERPKAEGYAAGVCIECRGAGVVIVPHPGLDPETGRWRAKLLPPHEDPDGERSATRTAAVCCVLCEKGRATREASEQANRPQLTISGYEALYRNSREVAKARAALLAAGRDATPPTAERVAELTRELDAARKAAAARAA
jgi:hypothetical protein